MKTAQWFAALGYVALLTACSSSSFQLAEPIADAGDDILIADSGVDTQSPPPDTSVPDTSVPDTSVPDTSVPDTSVPDTSVPDTAPSCTVSPYEPMAGPPSGYVCGVGECRVVLSNECRPKLGDGGLGSPCADHFGGDPGGNNKDDNCNGVVDEGYAVAQPNAGFQCIGCAWGRKVQRLSDGSLDTLTAGNKYFDYANNPACINSDLCKLPGTQWVRHAGFNGAKTCDDFCKAIGRVCKPVCSTVGSGCNTAAQKSGLGTFAADYACMSGTTPLTGDCAATLPSVAPNNAFNVYCCCAM